MAIRELMRLDRPVNIPVHRRNRFERSIASLQNEMSRMLDDFFSDFEAPYWVPESLERASLSTERALPSVDVIENETHFKVKADVAGITPDNIEVTACESYLTIKGERKAEERQEDENYLRHEMSYGSFYRTIPLPDTADTESASASFRDGILTLEVPKKAEALKKQKKIPVKKAA